MASEAESLMDVFINVLPDKDLNAVIDGMVESTMARIREKFGAAAAPVIKAPVISTSATSAGGGGGGGRGRGSDEARELVERYREAARAGEDLANQTRLLKAGFSKLGDVKLDAGLKLVSNEIRRVQVQLRRQFQDKDLLGIQESMDLIPALKNRLQSLNLAGLQLAMSGVSGRSGFKQLDNDAKAAKSSIGGLSNNAYQLGQAFEDAAVGFSLNGVAGAVRGASNNITFLIQNLTQAKIQAVQLSGKTVSPLLAQLPLYAAIGASIALLVGGPLAEWLESLNDIETKTKDIAEQLNRKFAEIKFEVDLDIEGSQLRRELDKAKTLDEFSDKIQKFNVLMEDAKQENEGFFKTFGGSEEIDLLRTNLRAATGDVTDHIDELKRVKELLLTPLGPLVPLRVQENVFGWDPIRNVDKQLADARKLSDTFGDISQAVEVLRLNLADGINDPKQIEDFLHSLTDVREQLVLVGKTIDVEGEAGEFVKKQLAAVDAMAAPIKAMSEISKQIDARASSQFNDIIERGEKKAQQLQKKLDIIRSTIEGIDRDQAVFLFDTQDTLDENKQQIMANAQLSDEQKKAAIALENKHILYDLAVRENDLRDDLLKTEKKIADIREKDRKSQFMSLETLSNRLQTNVLSTDPNKQRLQDALDEKEELLGVIAQNRIASGRVERGQTIKDIDVPFRGGMLSVPDPGAFDKRIGPADREMERALIAEMAKMVAEQKRTTEAVNGVDAGARAGK